MKPLNQKRSHFLLYIVPPLIVMVLMLINFYAKGIYPFGTKSVAFIDMGSMNVPMYCHVYDVLHGTKSLFFDWYSGLGVNMSASTILVGLVSPFNLLFYFVSRENILNFLSIFTMIKMMAASFSMFFLLHKKIHVNYFWQVLFSLLYAFSGYVLQYYTNSQWLEMVIILPFLALSVLHMLQNDKVMPYIFCLALFMILNIYSTIILFFILFIYGLYIFMFMEKGERKRKIFNLGIGTLAGIALGAVILIPAYKQITLSQRLNGETTLFQTIVSLLTTENASQYEQWWLIIGMTIPLVIIVKGFWANRKNKRQNFFVLACLAFLSLSIFFTSTDHILHFGRYVGFPTRFGYAITFVFILAACYYLTQMPQLNQLNNTPNPLIKNDALRSLTSFAIVIVGSILLSRILIHTYESMNELQNFTLIYNLSILLFITSLSVCFLLFSKRNHWINYRFVSVILIPCIMLSLYFFMPMETEHPEETRIEYLEEIHQTKDFDIPESDIDRVKVFGNTLNANYPFVMQRPGLSNWTHTLKHDVQPSFRELGYSFQYTRLLDSGGTIFSDALINNKTSLSIDELDENLYDFVDDNGTYKFYKNKYVLPFGLTVPNDAVEVKSPYYDVFAFQNAIFESLSGEEELIEPIVKGDEFDSDRVTRKEIESGETDLDTDESEYEEETIIDNSKDYVYKIKVEKKSVLYFYSEPYAGSWETNESFLHDPVILKVNGETVHVPTILHPDNQVYPSFFNDNVLELGCFENETVEVRLTTTEGANAIHFQFGLLDTQKFEDYIEESKEHATDVQTSKNSISCNVTGNGDDMLFLPMNQDNGWRATVNGEKVTTTNLYGTFIGVPLKEGKNEVVLTFRPEGFNTGLVISILTLLCIIGFWLLFKWKKFVVPGFILKTAEIVFWALYLVLIMVVYILPVGFSLIQQIIVY